MYSILSEALKMLYVNILYNQKILTFERKNLDLYSPGIHQVLTTYYSPSTTTYYYFCFQLWKHKGICMQVICKYKKKIWENPL